MSISERFVEFHRENPRVYKTLVDLARKWVKTTGSSKIGIKSLCERARWEIAVKSKNSGFRIDNSFTAFYARLIMENEPDLKGMFDTRVSEADRWMSKNKARAAASARAKAA